MSLLFLGIVVLAGLRVVVELLRLVGRGVVVLG